MRFKSDEAPPSARSSKRFYQLWKLAKDLSLDEISFLVTKRKNDLKYEKDSSEFKALRTEIKILEEVYDMVKKKMNRRR